MSDFGSVVSSGSPASTFRNFQLLTAAAGNFTVPDGVTALHVTMQAAGGGGGGIANNIATSAGGGPGEILVALMTVTPGQVIAYTNDNVGGLGGVAGNNNGAAGGNSTFGSLTASGGLGGSGSASGNATAALAPAITALRHTYAPTAALQLLYEIIANTTAGSAGTGGTAQFTSLGWGMPGSGVLNGAGTNATGYGPGGGGAGQTAATSALAGGNGAPGAIAVRW